MKAIHNIQKNFAKRVAMVIAAVMMVGSVWAVDKTYTFTASNWTATSGGSAANWTSNTNGSGFESTGSKRGVANNGVNGKCTSPDSYSGGVYSVSIVASSNAGSNKIKVLIGSTEIADKTIRNANNVTYTYTSADNSDIATLSGNVVIQVTQSSSTTWIKSVTISYATAAYTVTYNAGTGSCTPSSETESGKGVGVTLPSASPSASCATEGWTFAGWKRTSAQSSTTDLPDLISAGSTYHPASDESLYAVYKLGDVYSIDFESTPVSSYSSWDFNYIGTQQSTIISHGGSYHGTTTISSTSNYSTITTHSTVNPKVIRFYFARTTTNNTASTWSVEVSDDNGDSWESVTSQSAIVDTWTEVKQDLSSYSDVLVRIKYGGSTAVRAIDDVVLSCATYNSNPSCCATSVALSAGTETNATISSFSPSSVTTCGTGENDRKVTITVAAATGYEFTSSARLTYSGDGTATYISGPTGTGPYTFVYQFTKDDNGDGTFSVTSATPKTYTITYLDQGGGAFTGTQAGAPTTHTYGTATTLKIPTKFGHTFGGWYTASDCASGAVGTSSAASLAADGYTADITLYAKWTEKVVTNYRTSCCDYIVTFSQNDPEHGTVAFSKSRLTTCGATDGERQRTMTITPDAGYKLKTFEVATGDGKVAASSTSPDVKVDENNSDAQVITLTFAQNAEGNYDVTATFEEMHDEYYDYMHANAKQGANRTGVYNAPSLSSKTATTGADCKENHYKFKGWVAENEINENGTLKGGYTLISGGTSMTASNKKYYAVWAEEE